MKWVLGKFQPLTEILSKFEECIETETRGRSVEIDVNRCTVSNNATLCRTMPHYAGLCHTMPHYAGLCHTMPCYAGLCHTMPYYAILCHTMPHYAGLCHTMPDYATLCHTMPDYATLCHTMPHYAILCHTMPHYAILRHTMPHYAALLKPATGVAFQSLLLILAYPPRWQSRWLRDSVTEGNILAEGRVRCRMSPVMADCFDLAVLAAAVKYKASTIFRDEATGSTSKSGCRRGR